MITIPKINSSTKKSVKILLAPLDWGLGHATRCIPIVNELLRLECEVIIAAKGPQKAVLEQEFPLLRFVEIPGYNVKYGKNRALTLLKIAAKIPKILIRIKAENVWLKAFVQREKPDAVISDNRYGMHNKGIFSVFITHQLLIRTPFGRWADRILQRIQYRSIGKFSVCWVPDLENKNSLAGELSHPKKLPSIPVRYIGVLSRFETKKTTGGEEQNLAGGCDLLILLSGPEPQRTIFEKIILDQLTIAAARSPYPGKLILVRGLPRGPRGDIGTTMPPGLIVHDHLIAEKLNEIICEAALVICRPGYSSVMDLLKLRKKCIFVPTPGQTEQEYLGNWLSGRQFALCVAQTGFSLDHAIASAGNFSFRSPELPEDGLLRKTIGDWVSSLRTAAPGYEFLG